MTVPTPEEFALDELEVKRGPETDDQAEAEAE